MARSRWGFEFQSFYKPPSLSWAPYRIRDTAEMEYVAWLAKERGWDYKRASEYAHAQPHGRVLSAQFFGTPEAHEKAPKINWRNEARKALQYLRMGESGAALAILMKAA